MKTIIISMIEQAKDMFNCEDYDLYDEAYNILNSIKSLINQLAITFNAPSNWRDIGEELAEKYKDDRKIFETLQLYDYV